MKFSRRAQLSRVWLRREGGGLVGWGGFICGLHVPGDRHFCSPPEFCEFRGVGGGDLSDLQHQAPLTGRKACAGNRRGRRSQGSLLAAGWQSSYRRSYQPTRCSDLLSQGPKRSPLKYPGGGGLTAPRLGLGRSPGRRRDVVACPIMHLSLRSVPVALVVSVSSELVSSLCS